MIWKLVLCFIDWLTPLDLEAHKRAAYGSNIALADYLSREKTH